MHNINKTLKKFHPKNILLGLLLIAFLGCENTLQQEQTFETINYELYDLGNETSLKVVLDSDYEHETLIFNSEEEYENYALNLESIGEVKINPQFYKELSHALDPIEIHMLDKNRSIIVGNTKYTIDREALYAIDLSKENSVPELQIYYGLSGEEDLKEAEMVYIHRNKLEELATYHFKDPSARELYNEFVESYSDEDVIDLSSGEARAKCNSGSTCNYGYFFYNAPGGELYDFKYRNTSSGTIYTANIRWFIWNQSYRTGTFSLLPRGKGGTITEIDRLDGQGWKEMPENDDPIGLYHENGTIDTSKPWTYVKIVTNESTQAKSEYKWRVRKKNVNRGDNHGTESYHSANIRLNNQNQATIAMNYIYLL